TLKDRFAITFGMPGVGPDMRPIYVGPQAKLNLNNATLIARMDSRNLQYGTPYYLIQKAQNGTVTGVWGRLERGYANPAIVVSWYNPAELGENSAIVFSYASVEMPLALGAATGGSAGTPFVVSNIGGFNSQGNPYSPSNIGFFMITESDDSPIMIASSGLSGSDAGFNLMMTGTKYHNGFWMMPINTKVKAKDLGFDSDSAGFAMGLSGRLSKSSHGGLYVGYLRNNLDFKVMGADKEDQDLFLSGFSYTYVLKPYYIGLSAMGYKGKHYYQGKTGLNFDLLEEASYRSRGYQAELIFGGVYGKKARLVPEVGVSYSYHKTDAFRTKVPDNPNLAIKYEPDSLSVWKGVAGLSLVGEKETKSKMKIRWRLGMRVEQAISDNDVSVIIYAPNQPKYKLEKSLADTTWVIQGGVRWEW
ncbi:MAG: autotransporter outer membrane beta-barrel domain-containing protein, partial [Caldimicrobium sp.]|nr:autotransporter outer membrane beta-barrel domain-containing protein [Caldimicrobium sp.]MDW8183333.1 autotransporter outer membrane beta-barrel domain-containing protein [Caldimicrobium sp.]